MFAVLKPGTSIFLQQSLLLLPVQLKLFRISEVISYPIGKPNAFGKLVSLHVNAFGEIPSKVEEIVGGVWEPPGMLPPR